MFFPYFFAYYSLPKQASPEPTFPSITTACQTHQAAQNSYFVGYPTSNGYNFPTFLIQPPYPFLIHFPAIRRDECPLIHRNYTPIILGAFSQTGGEIPAFNYPQEIPSPTFSPVTKSPFEKSPSRGGGISATVRKREIISPVDLQEEKEAREKVVSVFLKLIKRCISEEIKTPLTIEDPLWFFCSSTMPTYELKDYLLWLYEHMKISEAHLAHTLYYLDLILHSRKSKFLPLQCLHRLLAVAIITAHKSLDDIPWNISDLSKLVGISSDELNKLILDFLFEIEFSCIETYDLQKKCYPYTDMFFKSLKAEDFPTI